MFTFESVYSWLKIYLRLGLRWPNGGGLRDPLARLVGRMGKGEVLNTKKKKNTFFSPDQLTPTHHYF